MAVAHDTGAAVRRGGSRLFVGFGLIALGVSWVLVRTDLIEISAGMVLPIVVIGLGVVTMLSAFDGPHPGLIGLGVVVSGLAIAAAVLPLGGVSGGIGDRTHRLTALGEVGQPYEVAIGRLTLDLTDLALTEEATLTAEVGVGSLVVIVPDDMAVDVRANSQLGEIDLFGTTSSGFDVERQGVFGERPDLILHLSTVLGSVEVRR